MEKEFIPYQQALALKELGFDEPCFGYYDNTGKLFFNTNGQPVGKDWVWEGNQIVPTDMVLVPTFSQAFRWFRENKNLFGFVEQITKHTYKFFVKDFSENKGLVFSSYVYENYEEAQLECLKKLFEI